MEHSARTLIAIFLLVIFSFIATGLVHYSAIHTLVANQQDQRAQRQIAVELANLVSLATMAETGQRGFVITGREEYLTPYLDAREKIPLSLQALRRALRQDPQQLQRLDALDRLNQMKLAELAESIAARRSGGFPAAEAIVLTNRGKAMMDDIRRTIAELDRVENARLGARIRASEDSGDRAFRTIGLAAALDLGLLMLLYGAVRRYQIRRDTAARERADADAMLRNVIDGSPALIYLVDLDGHFTVANKAFETIFGAARGKTVRQLVVGLPDADALRVHVQTDHAVMQAGGTIQYEQSVRAADGIVRHFLVSKVALHDHLGKTIGICAVAADITPLKTAENEIRQLNQTLEKRVDERTGELAHANAQLREVNEQLEAFSYTVAHDLRAPLRGMQGFADAIKEDYAGVLDRTGQDYLRRIVNAACRMERLIDDLLAFSRLSRMELHIGQVDLDTVMIEVTNNLAVSIADSHAALSIATGLPQVEANWSACVQIFQNLVSNAIKFARPGQAPSVGVGAERLPPAPQTGRRLVRVWITDAGIGISEQHRQRVFRPFERLHGMDEYPGSGIGLAIVDKAARRMGGACGVAPADGGGSRFWVDLPAAGGAR